MPARDRYHDNVVRALIKEGWTIAEEQYKLTVGVRRLWIDIRAEKAGRSAAILVEVKGFENSPSSVAELADAIGQYVTYQVALRLNAIDIPLFLAIPEAAYQGILSEELGKQVIRHIGMNLIVFEPEREEITKWIPS